LYLSASPAYSQIIDHCHHCGFAQQAIDGLRKDLRLAASAVQIPMGLENAHDGVIDLVAREAIFFAGVKGTEVSRKPIPEEYLSQVEDKRRELIERLAEIDDDIAELFIGEEDPTAAQLKQAIRKQTIAQKFVPVFMGSAYKNKGVQPLLDGVNDYLPAPVEVPIVALDIDNGEKEISLHCNPDKPLVALAFKLEESRFGQLTYIRIYQGTLKKGMNVVNVSSGKKVKVPRLVRMHSNEMEDVESVGAGDVVAVFGVECASMDTFTDGTSNVSLVSMFVPKPVMSLSVKPKDSKSLNNFSKALGKFTREDPTLRVSVDEKSNETIISGMGKRYDQPFWRFSYVYSVHSRIID
jgi:elongation factor G